MARPIWPDHQTNDSIFAVSYPNTLIFVDLPSDNPQSSAEFYSEVFGWEVEGRPTNVFHRAMPGDKFKNPDGTLSEIGNLHLGIYNVTNARPNPDPAGVAPRELSRNGRSARIWILVSDHDTEERILNTAEKLGATILWRNHYWKEFNGFSGAFIDPWGNTLIAWTKGGDNPVIEEGMTRE